MCINRFNSIPYMIDSRLTGNMDILQLLLLLLFFIIIYPLILLRSASDMTSKVHTFFVSCRAIYVSLIFSHVVSEVMSAYIDFLCFVFVYFLKVFTMNTEALLNKYIYIYIYIYKYFFLSRGEPDSLMTWLKIQK